MIIMLKLNKAKQLVKFVEFCCDGKQINLKRFFFQIWPKCWTDYSNSQKQSPGGVLEKSRKTANTHAKEIILVRM